jgi:hypothetical protein
VSKTIAGVILAIVGAIALTVVALHRHEPVNALKRVNGESGAV